MTKSMTGYGSASFENDQYSLVVELKSLNSKFLDFSSKIPKELSEHEGTIKQRVSKKLIRGKVTMNVDLIAKQLPRNQSIINKELFERYYQELKTLADEHGSDNANLFGHLLAVPDIVKPLEHEVESLDMFLFNGLLDDALEKCDQFRVQEGQALENMLKGCVETIGARLKEVISLEPQRKEAVKERLSGNLSEFVEAEKIDQNRLEQELIYYIEKLDINEEMVRLDNHLTYFKETLDEKESQGKKLGFISQEIGREINTIGSKANDAAIQRLVVEMKDELEKIKEQILNIV